MPNKLHLALAASLLISGVTGLAHADSPFPMSPNETGPYEAQPYYPPAGRSPAPAPVVQSSTFPVSVSESGPNDPDVYGITAEALAQPAEIGLNHTVFGHAGGSSPERRSVRVDPSRQYINVDHLERVRLVDEKGQAFVWTFDTLDEASFPLGAIAPSGFHSADVIVYVTHPYPHLPSE